MKIFQSKVTITEFLAFIIAVSVIRVAEYYLYTQNIFTIEQYRLSIQILIALAFIYIIALVIRNRNIVMIRPSRHTRSYKNEELDTFVYKLRDEGKSIEEISIASGLSIKEVEEKLDPQKEEPQM